MKLSELEVRSVDRGMSFRKAATQPKRVCSAELRRDAKALARLWSANDAAQKLKSDLGIAKEVSFSSIKSGRAIRGLTPEKRQQLVGLYDHWKALSKITPKINDVCVVHRVSWRVVKRLIDEAMRA